MPRRNASSSQPAEMPDNPLTFGRLEDIINSLVAYIVCCMGEGAIKKANIVKDLPHINPKNWKRVLQEATAILDNVYGLTLYQSLNDNNELLVYTKLDYLNVLPGNGAEASACKEKHCIVQVLIPVFMNRNCFPIDDLWDYFRSISVNPDEKHAYFGDVKKLVKTMVLQRYLTSKQDEDGKKVLSWGPKSEEEISKMDVLRFVAQKLNKSPEDFPSLLLEAENQQNRSNNS